MHAIYVMFQDLQFSGWTQPDLMLVGMAIQYFFSRTMRPEDYDSRRFNGALWIPSPDIPTYGVVMINRSKMNEPKFQGMREFGPNEILGETYRR